MKIIPYTYCEIGTSRKPACQPVAQSNRHTRNIRAFAQLLAVEWARSPYSMSRLRISSTARHRTLSANSVLPSLLPPLKGITSFFDLRLQAQATYVYVLPKEVVKTLCIMEASVAECALQSGIGGIMILCVRVHLRIYLECTSQNAGELRI